MFINSLNGVELQLSENCIRFIQVCSSGLLTIFSSLKRVSFHSYQNKIVRDVVVNIQNHSLFGYSGWIMSKFIDLIQLIHFVYQSNSKLEKDACTSVPQENNQYLSLWPFN